MGGPPPPGPHRCLQVELLRQHLYALALGYAPQDDHDALSHDVALKLSVWDRSGRRGQHERLTSQSSDWRPIDRLTSPPHRRALRMALAARATSRAGTARPRDHLPNTRRYQPST